MPTSLLRAGPLAADFVSGVDRPTFAVRNGHRLAVFPDVGITRTFFTMNMPTVFAQGDITVQLHWMAGVATGSDCVWEVAFERHQVGVDDLDSDSFGAPIVFVQAAPGTPGIVQEAIIPITAAQYDGILQGEQFRLRISRLADDTSDTMTGDAQLMTVVIEQDAAPAGGGGGGFWEDGAGLRAGIGKGSPAPTAIGVESLAHGTNATAGGANSFSLHGAAEGADSFVFGRNAYVNVSATDGVAIGRDTEVRASDGIAIGLGARAKGVGCVAIGETSTGGDNAPVNDFATAIGYRAQATGGSAVSIGHLALGYGDDHVVIGNNNYIWRDNNIIAIGSDITIGVANQCNYAIAIGTAITLGASGAESSIVIGRRILKPGSRSIIITNDQHNFTGGGPRNTGLYSNLMIKCTASSFAGIYASTGSAYVARNIAITTDGNSGLKNFNNNLQYKNILIGTDQAYIYGNAARNIVIGQAIDMGDFNNQLNSVERNIQIGVGRTGSYAQGTLTTEKNTAIGYECGHGTGVKFSTAIGAGCYTYSYNKYAYGNIAIGHYNRVGAGRGNLAMGTYNYISEATYTSFTWHIGNVALGFANRIQKTGTGGFRATLAHGVGANIAVSGQRAFSDDQSTGFNANANQAGFVIPKTETTDATQTTILTFPTRADKAYSIFGWMVARRTDADGFNAAFSLSNSLAFRNAAGAPTLVGAPKAWVMDVNQGAPGWTIDIGIVVNDIVVRVTGTAAQTIEWLGWIQVLEVRG